MVWIIGNSGGYVVFCLEKVLFEIFIMDKNKVVIVKCVWCWNLNGLGYFFNGVNGLFEFVMIFKGEIVVDFIKVGIINVNVL